MSSLAEAKDHLFHTGGLFNLNLQHNGSLICRDHPLHVGGASISTYHTSHQINRRAAHSVEFYPSSSFAARKNLEG